MEQQHKRTYESMVVDWVQTYGYCLNLEEQIKQGMIEEQEIEEYLKEKARLIVCLANLFAVKSLEEKNTYDKDYVMELFEGLKEELDKKELKLTDFDDNYITEMMTEMEKDLIEVVKEETGVETGE